VDYYENVNDPDAKPKIQSKMFLVDLAGSERMSVFDNQNKNQQQETININKSLMVLRKVIAGLGKKEQEQDPHIAYRECKLTQILK